MNLQLPIAPIVQRLRDQVPALRFVGGAAELQAARQQVPALPAAFVLPARRGASPSEWANQIVEQNIVSTFDVVFATRNLSDVTGAAAADALGPLANAICDALLNWQPDPDAGGFEYDGGERYDFADGVIFWIDGYRTQHLIRSI